MAIDTKRNNRLNPSLMHVFRAAHYAKDSMRPAKWRDKPDRNGPETPSRSAQRTAISETVLRQEVTRDLEAMMNSISFDSSVELAEFPFVRRSILNFGFPDLASRTIDELEVEGLEQEIERVIAIYEPRLVASSLRIRRDRRIDPAELKIRYLVHADLLCEPLNVPVEFVADVEVTTGKVHISRL